MSTRPITLYDLPRKPLPYKSWSPNVWKSRLVLNYKSLPYTTSWLKHADISPAIKALGVPPNELGPKSAYTVPVIHCPDDGSSTMDSAAIAQKLEALYPEPSLHLDAGLHERAAQIIGKIALPLIPVFMPCIARDVLVEESVAGFRESRAKRFGMSLDELEAKKGGEQAWQAAAVAVPELVALLQEHKRDEGPYVLGSKVSYADFVVASMIESLKRIGGEDMFERCVGQDGSGKVRALHAACAQWMEKDD